MDWWMWLLVGFVLLMLELVTPGGFFVFFFGVGAVAVGLLVVAGLAPAAWAQWALFSALSVSALVFFRKPLLERMRKAERPGAVDSLIGETAVALSSIDAEGIGKAELRGTSWTAKNVGGNPVQAGQRCTVENVVGLMLWIRG